MLQTVSRIIRFAATSLISFTGLVVILLALCGVVTVKAQMESANYRLSSGSFIGGGGSSSGGGKAVVGSFIGAGGKMSFADNWACYSGPIGIPLGAGGELLAFYSTQTFDTVEIAPQKFKVSYGGGAGTLSGRLFFRPGGATGYDELTMIKAEGDTLTLQLPSDSLGLRGLEFYFRFTRGSDTLYLAAADSPYVWITHFTNELGQIPSLTRERSYRMIGLPIEIEGSRQVDAVFEDDLGPYDRVKWRLGGFDPRQDTVFEFTETYSVAPGRGYWLITRDRERFGAAGHSVRPNLIYDGKPYLALPMQRGWNQIANPYDFAVDFQDVLFEKSGVVSPHDSSVSIYWYAGAGYSTPKIMTPWTGYFFFTWETNLRILIPYEEFGVPSGAKLVPLAKPSASYDWGIGVTMIVGDKRSETCYAGMASSASDSYDELDQPLPPTPPGEPVCGFTMADHNRYLWRIDSRQPSDSLQSWNLTLGKGSGRQLQFSQVESVPYEQSALLVLDIGTQETIRSEQTVAIPDDVSSATLYVGPLEKVELFAQSNLPDHYELAQNYPNPFNPNTSIRFSLPQAGNVRLEIFNLLGQRVRLLADHYFEAGVHTLEWNGQFDNGTLAASGLYLYRLVSDNFTASKKMLLIK